MLRNISHVIILRRHNEASRCIFPGYSNHCRGVSSRGMDRYPRAELRAIYVAQADKLPIVIFRLNLAIFVFSAFLKGSIRAAELSVKVSLSFVHCLMAN